MSKSINILKTIRKYTKSNTIKEDLDENNWGKFSIPKSNSKYPWWSDRNVLIKDSLGKPINDRPLNLILSSQNSEKLFAEKKHIFIVKDGSGEIAYKAIFDTNSITMKVKKNLFLSEEFRNNANGKLFFIIVKSK